MYSSNRRSANATPSNATTIPRQELHSEGEKIVSNAGDCRHGRQRTKRVLLLWPQRVHPGDKNKKRQNQLTCTLDASVLLSHTQTPSIQKFTQAVEKLVKPAQRKKQVLTRILPLRALISANFFLSSSNRLSNRFCLSFLFSLDWKR